MDTGDRIWCVFLDGHIIYQERSPCYLSDILLYREQPSDMFNTFLLPGGAPRSIRAKCRYLQLVPVTVPAWERKHCLEEGKRSVLHALSWLTFVGDQFFYVQIFVLSLHNGECQRKAGRGFWSSVRCGGRALSITFCCVNVVKLDGPNINSLSTKCASDFHGSLIRRNNFRHFDRKEVSKLCLWAYTILCMCGNKNVLYFWKMFS